MSIADKIRELAKEHYRGGLGSDLADIAAEVEALERARPPTTGREVTLTLPMSPTENHMRKSYRGRRAPVLTQDVHDFRNAVAVEWMRLGVAPLTGRLASSVVFNFDFKGRSSDIRNRLKALDDALQLAGVFADDVAIDHGSESRGPQVAGGRCVVTVREIAGCPPVKAKPKPKRKPKALACSRCAWSGFAAAGEGEAACPECGGAIEPVKKTKRKAKP